MQQVLGRPDVEVVHERPTIGPSVRVTTAVLSGLAFWPAEEEPPEHAETLGWLRLPPEVLEMAAEETRVRQAREDAELLAVDAVLRDWVATGELDRRLVELADRVERVETVYVLVGREVFSKSDAGSNTLTRDALLEKLRNRPPEQWRSADRLFVVAAHCLFTSGRSVRFEEFNARQLSATALRDYLTDRYATYCTATGHEPSDLHRLSLTELAERVRALMVEVDHSPWMRYRRINGLTFVKNEYLADIPLPRDPATVPELVAEHGRVNLAVSLSGDVRADLRAMTMAAAALDAASAGPDADDGGAIGELLGAIVLSAVTATDSDYGMSSAVRDLARLRGARPGAPDGTLALKKANFFCCCLPHPTRMRPLATEEETVPILWRAAQRMMYNRWHFAPGEFDRAVIPQQRHYFFPPQVPDIAEHAEHHHGGHVASRVRFSIRAPGAQVWRPPFEIFGHGYRGCYDIRLVRMEGPAYTMSELRTAVEHCSLVDVLWRTLADGVERDAFPVRPVGGFDKTWYESRGWQRMRPYLLAAGLLTGPSPR
ncbi:hypothetical protein [Micromonospora humidisoli]|uniref:Lantibiotic dehydratase, C terminus n=1 Tax=Micromonospora humidisoli TaxID=2807622 RepID=A0ABS2JE58_9ACTN|nr:hypothetical protein [Micromonospora humidisoli]MBM7084778.1 hypothetical protein [Micromonospora humidisoli]